MCTVHYEISFEIELRRLVGDKCFFLNSIDKLLKAICKHLQTFVTDEVSIKLIVTQQLAYRLYIITSRQNQRNTMTLNLIRTPATIYLQIQEQTASEYSLARRYQRAIVIHLLK